MTEESLLVRQWLSQFDEAAPDRYLAGYLLKKMRFVSFEEFEKWIQDAISELIQEITESDGRVSIAIFPVRKPTAHKFNEDKEPKAANDSSGRIGHSLKNIERALPKYVEVSPRDNSMSERRVRHIIFVDDFIGTGNRFIKSWRSTVSRRIKSWCSRGWCKIWLLSFAGHTSGIRHISNQIRALDASNIRVNLVIDKHIVHQHRSLQNLLHRYGERIEKPSIKFGYGKLASPIVFQHGCPNNTPGVFWSHRKGQKGWNPLFPERSVPESLYSLFKTDYSLETTSDELWMIGHYSTALNFLDKIKNFNEKHRLILILGYLKNNKPLERVRNALVFTHKEFQVQLNELKNGGLIDADNTLTKYGDDILKRISSSKEKNKKQKKNEEYSNFFPASFLGFQREI